MNFNVLVLIVDMIIGGNCECDLCIGFILLLKLILGFLISFVIYFVWVWNFLIKEKFDMLYLFGYVF